MSVNKFQWKFALAALIVMAMVSLAIPDVRAAISAWLGLSVAPSENMPVEAVTLVPPQKPTPEASIPQATTVPVNTPQVADPGVEKPVEVDQLSSQAGWDILYPAALPEGYSFTSAYLDANHQMGMLTFAVTRPLAGASDPSLTETKTITVLQALKNDFVPMQVAPNTNLTDVQVNGLPAVFTVGAWDTQYVSDANNPNSGQMVSTWRNDLQIQNLYWQSGDVYVVIITDDASLNMPQLIEFAATFGQ